MKRIKRLRTRRTPLITLSVLRAKARKGSNAALNARRTSTRETKLRMLI
jgi:hypothetical protein